MNYVVYFLLSSRLKSDKNITVQQQKKKYLNEETLEKTI